MDDDSRVIDRGWDALPEYASTSGDADDAVTVSISTTPGEWLVNTVDAVVVPMSMAEVVEALRHRKLTERSLVWRAGMQEWAPVDKVPQLKLAARMAPAKVAAPSAPPRPTPAANQRLTEPGPRLPNSSSPPRPQRATPAPTRGATPPPADTEEPEVLAVYARPAATTSFDLSPVEAPRSAPPSAPAPQTLAPTTTDSAQRQAQASRNAELSVVAASDFRQVQRSSKRLVLISSLASAAAASLVTFALSRGHTATTAVATPVVAAAAAPAPVAAPLPVAPTPAPGATTTAAPEPKPSEAAAPAPAIEKPKLGARKAKAVRVAPRPRPEAAVPAAPRDPVSDPNPYDVRLDEEAPSTKPTPAPATTHGSGLEAADDVPQAPSSTTPGF